MLYNYLCEVCKKTEHASRRRRAIPSTCNACYCKEPGRRSKRLEWMSKNRLKIRVYQNAYRRQHPPYEESKARAKVYNRQYVREKSKTDLNFRLRRALRVRIHDILKGQQKAGSAIRDLGCTWEELKAHLESLFQPGMTWDNWGLHGWHIDHKTPLAAFDLSDPDQFKKAVHYTNLQPLWARENQIKGARLQPNNEATETSWL